MTRPYQMDGAEQRAKLARWETILILAGIHPLKAILIVAAVAGDMADERKAA
jgi:hypothetical protein